MNEPDVTVEDISPHRAAEYLTRNVHNRPMRSRVVAAYARDIRNGDWHWNGEAIKFDLEGTLLDGQHRLAAIVEADLPLKCLVIRGLPTSTQDTMDGGIKRTFSDVLKLRGEANNVTLAAIVTAVAAFEQRGRKGLSHTGFTNAELFRTLEAYPWLRDGVHVAQRARRNSAMTGSVAGLAWWLFVQIDAEDAEHFFDRLASEAGHLEGEPVFMLRRALASATDKVKGSSSREYQLALTIKAWNAYRAGETVGLLRFRRGGASPEKFPEAI